MIVKDNYTDGIEDVITDEEKITSVDKLLEEEKQVIVKIKNDIENNVNNDIKKEIIEKESLKKESLKKESLKKK